MSYISIKLLVVVFNFLTSFKSFFFKTMRERKKKKANRTRNTVNKNNKDFPGGPVVKNPSADAGDTGSILGLGRFHMLQSN